MDISEFYDGDPRRRESSEVRFGDGWSTETDEHSTYRAEWLFETGELYVVREPHPGGLFARFLDQLDIDQVEVKQLTVEILGTFKDEQAVQASAGRLGQAHDQAESLDWLREAAAARRSTAGVRQRNTSSRRGRQSPTADVAVGPLPISCVRSPCGGL